MSNIIFSEVELAHIVYYCDAAAYKTLSDPSVSKTTASMSEEGREAVAACISKKLRELLEQAAEQVNAAECPSDAAYEEAKQRHVKQRERVEKKLGIR